MRHDTGEVEYAWERDDLSEVAIVIGYDWTPLIPASFSGPAEGGCSVDYITAKTIKWFTEDGDQIDRTATLEELSEAEIAFPSDKAYEISCEDYDGKMEAAEEAAADLRRDG